MILETRDLRWTLDTDNSVVRTASFENLRSGLTYALTNVTELALVFSAQVDAVAEPLRRVDDFTVKSARQTAKNRAQFELRSAQAPVSVTLHVHVVDHTRRKWVEVKNTGKADLLLLDVELDQFSTDGTATGGGPGQPIFIEDEVFAAIEHPAGVNQLAGNRLSLAHHPGRRLAKGETYRSKVAIVSVARAGEANRHFLSYVEDRSPPRPRMLSVYTPFGINNQWGAAPTLDDEQTLDVLGLLEKFQRRGITFDYFTLDTGWNDFASDLTRFRPVAYPTGPKKVVERVRQLGMKFGLWFATSWGLQSCWDFPPAFPDGKMAPQPYREGYPLGADGVTFCLGEPTYFNILKRAVLHHVRENRVRFLKFDGGWYHCDRHDHGHLPGKYATEAMYEKLIDIAESARRLAPDVFVMWYWGLRSPFWALHGDAIFESGLHMEGSGTSTTPTLYYRDSVTLAQDQNAHNAKTIPPRLKDSLGVWLSDSRWGNFMGVERWRENLVMDLGRGSRLFPNVWGNLYSLSDDDVAFLARMERLAHDNAALFADRRLVGGDPFRNDVYGYAHGKGARSFVFVNNVHFTSRKITMRLDESLGLAVRGGATLAVRSHFPEDTQLVRPDGDAYRTGDALEIWLRPFEVLMLEIAPPSRIAAALPRRELDDTAAAQLGRALALTPTSPDPRLALRFADAAKFEEKKFVAKLYTLEGTLPELAEGTPIVSFVIRLRKGDAEWKYAPTVVQIVQAIAQVGDRKLHMIPMPDGRQHGNTQSFGCSWLVYRSRIDPALSGAPVKVAIHAWLPEDVEARVESWVVQRWWTESARPTADGYYTYAPS